MKYDYERIALWSIVIILVIVVLFQQRRSGFSLKSNTDSSSISLLDLMEYKSIPETKRTIYKSMLTSNASTLKSMTDGGMYKMKVDEIMMAAFKTQKVQSVPTSSGPSLPCSNAYIMGGCSAFPTCPAGLNSVTVGGSVYCVCNMSTPGVRFTMNPAMSPDGAPTCSASAVPCPQSTVTEVATGQRMCVSQCPPLGMPGTTCA